MKSWCVWYSKDMFPVHIWIHSLWKHLLLASTVLGSQKQRTQHPLGEDTLRAEVAALGRPRLLQALAPSECPGCLQFIPAPVGIIKGHSHMVVFIQDQTFPRLPGLLQNQ